jgi:hypothetical protein
MAKKNVSKSKTPASNAPAAKSASKPASTPKAAFAAKPIAGAARAPSVGASQAKASPAKKVVTTEQIARRAYEIYASGKGGTEAENWHRAEQELRNGQV